MIGTQKSDFEGKVRKLRELIQSKNAKALLVKSQANFTWLTGGRGFIAISTEGACASLLITMDKVHLFTRSNELGRLCEEELAEVLGEMSTYSDAWYENSREPELIASLTGGEICLQENQVDGDIRLIRSQLSELEIQHYRELSQTTAGIVETVCRSLKPGVTENEIAGQLSAQFWKNGIQPTVLLIAFDERIQNYRHPLPTDNPLKKYAMLSVCGRKRGLVTSITRMASLGPVDEDRKARHQAVSNVLACLFANTRPGAVAKEIFARAIQAYETNGYGEEWKLHPQGGMAAYASREWVANIDNNHLIKVNQAFAWNPTITGTKAEETIVTLEHGNEVLTHTGKYVYLAAQYQNETLLLPDILVL